MMSETTQRDTAQRLLRQAWPVLIGQLAVMANGIVDSVMAGRAGSDVLAAVAVGSAVYISLYVGLMGVILAITPISASHFGAKRFAEVGKTLGQGLWLAVGLSAFGILIMLFPEPLLAVAKPSASMEASIRAYLHGIAVGLPAALIFRVFYTSHQAISMPKVVMRLQVLMLAIKVPLNAWLMFGGWGLDPMGAAGCGWSTAITQWAGTLVVWGLWVGDSRYKVFKAEGWLLKPDWPRMRYIIKLGLPIGGAYLIEVTSFTVVAILVARFGNHQVAGHQIVANMAATCYMLPLALANATSVLAAQRLGAKEPHAAARFIKSGLLITGGFALLLSCTLWLGSDWLIGFYTQDPETFAVAKQLLPWIAAYHLFDGVQTVCAFVLRAFRIATAPMIIYGVCLWGMGLTGGVWVGIYQTPPMMALGFWIAALMSLALAALLMFLLMGKVVRDHLAEHDRARAA